MPNKKCNPRLAKAKNPEYICNPETGKWVLKSSPAGRRIQRQNAAKEKKPKKIKKVPPQVQPVPYVAAPPAQNNPPENAVPMGMNDLLNRLMNDNDQQRPDGFYPRQNIPVDPEIVYIEKDTGYVWAMDIYNKIKNVKNEKLKQAQWKPICKLIPKKNLKYYEYNDLAKVRRACKLPSNISRTKRGLYNYIDWNNRKKCSNEYTFMGDQIGDIPGEKIIRINDVCYNVDELAQHLISSKGKNVDMYNKELKIWNSPVELEDIVKTHRGLDPDLKKEWKKIQKQKIEDLRKVFKSKDTIKILGNMGRAGWASISDNPFNHDTDPNVFQMSQKSLSKLINSVNKSPNKETWLNITSPKGVKLGELIKNLSSTCIHGVGFKLTGLYVYLIGMSRKLKAPIRMLGLFVEEIKNKKYLTFEIYSNGGSSDKLSKKDYNEEFRLIDVDMEQGYAQRIEIHVRGERYKKFLKSGIIAQRMIKAKSA